MFLTKVSLVGMGQTDEFVIILCIRRLGNIQGETSPFAYSHQQTYGTGYLSNIYSAFHLFNGL